MNKIRFSLNVLAFAAFTIALSAVAQAQATRTWVSGVGDDANPCSRTAPCKTYAGAISKTARDGEISTLDPGGFGAVTITKSITINGGGTGQGYGSILASSTNGVIVNITDAADTQKTVRLNWLDINGAPSTSPGLNGIRILAADFVHIENTHIDAFRASTAGNGNGISIDTTTAATRVFVRNTTIRGCLSNGIRANTTGANLITLIVTNSKISNSGTGIKVLNGGRVMVSGSEISRNATAGIDIEEIAGGSSIAHINGNNISFNGNGIESGAGAVEVRLSDNFIAGNAVGIQIIAGQVFSSGNNRVMGNGTDGAPNQAVVQPI
ncbi:MAG TPA: right-handed parallel beta-helix repeat-containing protein [Pyrinomonadaceae bacterium]|nr:right-handed parallel beta-helix repeat-containing protein [Pyrinomonadaceae bacterium]